EREPRAVFAILGVCLLRAGRDARAAHAELERRFEDAVIEEIQAGEQAPKVAVGAASVEPRANRRSKAEAERAERAAKCKIRRGAIQRRGTQARSRSH